MEFNFKINELFKEPPVVKITNTLLSSGFTGDQRDISFCEQGIYIRIKPPPVRPALVNLREYQTKVAEVINAMGIASTVAQGLEKPITTADKLRDSNYTVYLLFDLHGGLEGNGCVTGLLKVGRKGLKLFDPVEHHHQLKPLCVLDFYIHESRQRTGLGHQLFEYMLKEENVEPVALAIDRPNKQLLRFLSKHYNLNHIIPQMNKFVVFEGFFVLAENAENEDEKIGQSNNSSKLMDTHTNENSSSFQKCTNTGARGIHRYVPHKSLFHRNKMEDKFAVFDNYSTENSSSYPEPKNEVAAGLGRHGALHPSDHMMDQVNPVIGDNSTENLSSYPEPKNTVTAGLGRHGAHHPSDHMMDQVNPVIGDNSTENSSSYPEPKNTVTAGLGRHGAHHPSDHMMDQVNPVIGDNSTENLSSYPEPKNVVTEGLGRHGAHHPSDHMMDQVNPVIGDNSTENLSSYPEPKNTVTAGLGRHGAHHPSDHMMDQVNPVIGDNSTENSSSYPEPKNVVEAGLGRHGAYHPPDHVFSPYYATESSRNFQNPINRV